MLQPIQPVFGEILLVLMGRESYLTDSPEAIKGHAFAKLVLAMKDMPLVLLASAPAIHACSVEAAVRY